MPPGEKITLELPAEHVRIMRDMSAETGTTPAQIVAQAIAMLHAVHIGVWHIENAQLLPQMRGPVKPRKLDVGR
jgi:hypothetical protein